jgi:hypothetical protein
LDVIWPALVEPNFRSLSEVIFEGGPQVPH